MKRLLAFLALLVSSPALAGGPITVGPGLGPYNVDSLNGLFQGTGLQVGDVFQSGLYPRNWSIDSDNLGPGSANPAVNAGWGPVNAGSTITWTNSTAVSQPDAASYVFNPTNIAAISCANGSTACSAGGSDFRIIVNSNSTGWSDQRLKTVTFSVWVETASGTNAGFTLKLARYQDNEPQTTTCSVVSTQWTRCVLIATFSNTSYTDNSEVRAYVIPYSTTTHYLAYAQLEHGAGATPYQSNDTHTGVGSALYSAGAGSTVGPPGYSQGGGALNGPPTGTGGWAFALGVGNTAQDPYSGFAFDGSLFVGNTGYITVTAAGGYVRLAQVSGAASAPKLRAFAGSPSGTITGTAGDIIVDSSTPGLWQSTGGTAWSQIGSVGAGGTNNTIAKFTPNGYTLGNSSITDNGTTVATSEAATIGGATTINNTLTVTGAANASTITANNSSTAQTVAANGLFTTESGTFNTTAGGITEFGVESIVSASRSSGANSLTNIALYGSATNGQNNYALYTDSGNVLLNATSGTTTITGHSNGANDLSVVDSLAGSTQGVIGIYANITGTFNTTSGALQATAINGTMNTSRSAGTNTLTAVGLYGAALGGQTNYALLTGQGDVLLNQVNGTTTIDGATTINNTTNSVIAAGTGFTSTFANNNLILDDSTATAQGVGASLVLRGKYNTGITGGATIKTMKTNATGTDDGFGLVFGVRLNGSSDTTETVRLTSTGHINSTATTALSNSNLSSCGTGTPTLAAGSDDVAGTITEGTTTAACTLTFANTYTSVPTCTCSSRTAGANVTCTESATTLVFANTSASGTIVKYVCIGQNGGT